MKHSCSGILHIKKKKTEKNFSNTSLIVSLIILEIGHLSLKMEAYSEATVSATLIHIKMQL